MVKSDMEYSDDSDNLDLSDEEKNRIISLMEKMMEMGIGSVYCQEDEGLTDAEVDCEAYISLCKAKCCTFRFALTKEEVEKGRIKYNVKRPFFIERDADGYCNYIERHTLKCTIWEERPIRCRRYDCREDPNVWPEGVPGKLR